MYDCFVSVYNSPHCELKVTSPEHLIHLRIKYSLSKHVPMPAKALFELFLDCLHIAPFGVDVEGYAMEFHNALRRKQLMKKDLWNISSINLAGFTAYFGTVSNMQRPMTFRDL